jgi:CBS domain-containing protein
MGYQLWMSSVTGYRRKGTRFSSLQKIFMDNVTVKDVYEPLLCCKEHDDAVQAQETLKQRGFNIAGVMNELGEVVGYVETDTLVDNAVSVHTKKITIDQVISDSTPLAQLLNIFREREFAYVNHGSKIVGIITKADINKPPVRVYLFGTLSLFEMHVNTWIKHFYPNDSWFIEIKDVRIDKAKEVYEKRKGKNQDLTLLDCIQLADKREILSKSLDFLKQFGFDKKSFVELLKRAEKIRNELVHSQDSIISNLEWSAFVDVLDHVECFLLGSDNAVEKMATEGAKDFEEYLALPA